MHGEASLTAVGSGWTPVKERVGDDESKRLEEIRKGVEGGAPPELFLESGESGPTEENRGESLGKRGALAFARKYLYLRNEASEICSKVKCSNTLRRHDAATCPPIRHLAKAVRRHRTGEPRPRRFPTTGILALDVQGERQNRLRRPVRRVGGANASSHREPQAG